MNDWIRTSGAYDAVIDFDAVVRDSSNPQRFLLGYQPGDRLHPNDAGYRVMAEAVDLTLFRNDRLQKSAAAAILNRSSGFKTEGTPLRAITVGRG